MGGGKTMLPVPDKYILLILKTSVAFIFRIVAGSAIIFVQMLPLNLKPKMIAFLGIGSRSNKYFKSQ